MRFVLKTIPLPINQTYRRGKNSFYKTREASKAQEDMGWEVKSQYRGKPFEGNLKVSIAFYWPRARRDIDSSVKATLDALTGILWVDDSQITDLVLSKQVDKVDPRLVIEVLESGNEEA